VSFTAVSTDDFWLLGQGVIVQTTDGGKSFHTFDSPLPPQGESTPVLRFADSSDGFAYLERKPDAFYVTHDDGTTWHRVPLDGAAVIAFATGGGFANVVTVRCTDKGVCSDMQLKRAAIGAETWTSSPLPFTPSSPEADLAAHGSSLWLLAPRGNANDGIAKSTDAGASFSTATGPCYSDLGGDLEPSSTSVVWATCPTGMLSGAWRSTDTGQTFAQLKTPPLENAAIIAPASDTTAVIGGNDGRKLLRTTDGGATWSTLAKSPLNTFFIGFTDAQTGSALSSDGSHNVLWRSTDGGATWSIVPIR
jgi:photosystem II stability/assembly factor-like uncharacterized protein